MRFTIVSGDENRRLPNTYDIVLEAIGAAIIVIGSYISLTVLTVPFTLQTLAIFAVLMTTGGKRGTVSIFCYLLLGTIGLPVFAGFKGGFASILGPTGGFLIGFIPMGLIYLVLADKVFDIESMSRGRRVAFKAWISVVCELVLYIVGVAWFMTVYAAQTGPVGLMTALGWCVFPFLIPDAVKIVFAITVSEACRGAVKK